MTDLITVIVPVYKVEDYLHKCVDSILQQTYSNLEIILVDDGSPDTCGSICDEYEKMDSRIITIHQKNGGLSAARNTGLRMAKGTYVTFVDSDDWIEADMVELLYSTLIAHDTKMSVLGHNEEKLLPDKAWGIVQVLQTAEALAILLQDSYIKSFVWGKLYALSIFDKENFPSGKIYEDVYIMHRLFIQCNSIAFLNECKYHYTQRSDSITGQVTLRLEIHMFYALHSRMQDLVSCYPELASTLFSRIVGRCCYIHKLAYSSHGYRDQYLATKKDILDMRKFMLALAAKDTLLSKNFAVRCKLLILKYAPFLLAIYPVR